MKNSRFLAPADVCAIHPRAYGAEFYLAPIAPTEDRGGIAIVNVRGPLMHHADNACFDSYDAIKGRVQAALLQSPRAIVLSIDSPGGLVSGCFDTAVEIRAICDAAGVPLMAYIDGQADSAAYALAAVARRIAIPPTAEAGSIGCIAEMTSTARLDQAMGLDRRIVTSGERKADGNPGSVITDEAEAAVRAKVVQLATLFAAHVATYRPVSLADVLAMQAGVVIGADAVPALADAVMGLDEMVAAIAAGTFAEASADATGNGTETKMKNANTSAVKAEGDSEDKKNPFAAARAALQAVADDDKADEKARSKAKAALAAMAEDKTDDAKAAAEEPKKDEAKAAKEEPSDADKDVSALLARLDAIENEHKVARAAQDAARVKAEADERASLIASRPDLDAASKALLATAPLADVRAYVAAAPRRALRAAATAVVKATLGAGQVDDKAPGAPMAQDARAARGMRIAMGIERPEPKVIHNGSQLIIGAMPEHLLEMDENAAE